MSSRYDERERGRNDRRSESDYSRSYGERPDMRYGYAGERESEKYTRELGSDRDRFWQDTSDYQRGRENYGRESYGRSGRENYGRGGREGYWGGGWENEHDERSRYGNPVGGSGFERGYNQSRDYSQQQYNYPSGYRTGNERYNERSYDYDRDRYQGEGREGRGWWDRASDEVASWFGDEDAERRRRMDDQRQHRGRGPKGYKRSDERIREDVNDRLSDDYYLDASDVEVSVSNTEVTLTGTVNSRSDKRRAEDLAERVSGVSNVENRLRVRQSSGTSYTGTGTGATSSTGTTLESTGTTGTTTSSAAAGGGTGRSRTTGD